MIAAPAVAHYIQDAIGISIKRVIRILKPLQDVTINLNGHQITAQPQLAQTATSIPRSLQTQGTKTSQVRPGSFPHRHRSPST